MSVPSPATPHRWDIFLSIIFLSIMLLSPLPLSFRSSASRLRAFVVQFCSLRSVRSLRLKRNGTSPTRPGTDHGTPQTCKIPNVYRPWDAGTGENPSEGLVR